MLGIRTAYWATYCENIKDEHTRLPLTRRTLRAAIVA